MARRWLDIHSCNGVVLFLAMGAFAACFAWTSYNLFMLAMQNVRFLREFGLVAVMEGGLRQLIEIIAYGYLSLAFYLGFKACETELVSRWRSSRPQK